VSRRAVVEELAALGAAVHICSRKEAELAERLKEWEAKGFRVTVSVCDLSVREQRERLVRDVGDRFGSKLDILVSRSQSPIQSVSSFPCHSVNAMQCSIHSCTVPYLSVKYNGVYTPSVTQL
jgi:Tropinone reductase 1